MMPIQFYCAHCTQTPRRQLLLLLLLRAHAVRAKVLRRALRPGADFYLFSTPVPFLFFTQIFRNSQTPDWVRSVFAGSSGNSFVDRSASLLLFPLLSLSQFTVVAFVRLPVINIFCWQVVRCFFSFHSIPFHLFSLSLLRWCRTSPGSASLNSKANRTAPRHTTSHHSNQRRRQQNFN